MLGETWIGLIEIDGCDAPAMDAGAAAADDATLEQTLARLAGRSRQTPPPAYRFRSVPALAVAEADLEHLLRDLHRETCRLHRAIALRRCAS